MTNLQIGEKVPAPSDEGGACSQVPVAIMDMGTQSHVSPGHSSGENSPSASQEYFDDTDGDVSVPSALNDNAGHGKSGGTVKATPTVSIPLGTNAVISTNDVDDDDDDDDDWFSPKGPPSGAEHGIKRPVKPIIKK